MAALSQLFRRYSTANDSLTTSQTYVDRNSIIETLLEELESQCRTCSNSSTTPKRNSQTLNPSSPNSLCPPETNTANRRHSSVDYSWLTPNKNLLQSTNEIYHLSDIIKMELAEQIRNVSPEDCTMIINQFRRNIREQVKINTPENIIAMFRKTLSEYSDSKIKNRSANSTQSVNYKVNGKFSAAHQHLSRNNRVNPKNQADDERHCIAELTEISISSSNDGSDNRTHLTRHS